MRESDSAAARILQLFRFYEAQHRLHQIPACAVAIAFLAGVVFIYQVERLRHSGEDPTGAKENLNEILQVLSAMERTWQSADVPRAILERYNLEINPVEVSTYVCTFPLTFSC